MRWRRLGLVFAPRCIAEWSLSHASVPIALPRDGHRVRVYFSARDAEQRSHTGWFELDLRTPGRQAAVAEAPVLRPGPLGSFDEDGAMGCWLSAVGDELWLYYIGWSRARTVPFRNAIGLAISRDGGDSFERVGPGPVLDRHVDDPFFTASPCAWRAGDEHWMYYASCVRWEARPEGPRHHYLIRRAVSADGIVWPRREPCLDFAPGEYALSRPCVLRDGDLYRMWYSRRGDRYRIGYAESRDGVAWQRRDDLVGIDVAPEGWDSEMIEYAHVFDAAGARYMLYNGNGYGATGIGLAVLEDG